MSWGNEPDNDYEPRRRKFRDRFGSDEDVFGAADAEDRFDNDSAEDLSFGHHAAGLDYDRNFEQPYQDRQQVGDYPQGSYSGAQTPPRSPHSPGGANRAEQLRDRMARRPDAYQRTQRSSDPIDRMFDAKPGLPRLPCSNSIMLFLIAVIAVMVCLVMAFLAAGSLTRLLGI